MWYLLSNDDGATWHRQSVPRQDYIPSEPWLKPRESDPATPHMDDPLLPGESFNIAGDFLIRYQINGRTEIRLATGPASGPFEYAVVRAAPGLSIRFVNSV